ncbi:ABC transporter permease subunit [Romboutsia sp. CE17]|uniref:ABC transporter permease n=1 Tax=Romboutsia sp. CE17 TaxID=2724150 RepID=UPI001442C7A5|nr:ABC transporter permease subunit [Romboutsia sp. CE17]QJA07858.1 ABC transporter permease subunit [Romboutsia sp. CE17]
MKEFSTKENKACFRDKIEVMISCVMLLFLWQIIALKINNDIYLPTITQVLISMKEIVLSDRFYLDIIFSMSRCILSFISAILIALILSTLSYISRFIRNLLKPITVITKSIPTMIVIVLVLIWFDKNSSPFIIGFIIVFPILYDSILDSILNIDKGILEMANLYNIGLRNKALKIYLPSIKFRIISIIGSTFSLALKVIIAGEVYGQPKYGMGTQIQLEKINFNTSGIFAWIIIIIIISFVLENFQKPSLRRSLVWKR